MLFGDVVADIVDGAKAYRLWSYLAWQDIRLRYRRSRLGPFWITLSMGIFIAALGFVFSKLFKMSIKDYLPFLATGYVLWFFISSVVAEAPNVFVESGTFLKEMKINLLVLLMRAVTRNTIIFAHNVVIVFFVYFFFDLWPGPVAMVAILGFALVTANLVAVSLMLGILGARFRDIAPTVQSLVQVLFFISPISWLPKLVGDGNLLLSLNPITYFMDLVRSPLLGSMPSSLSWVAGFGFFALCTMAAMVLYWAKGKRVVFWV